MTRNPRTPYVGTSRPDRAGELEAIRDFLGPEERSEPGCPRGFVDQAETLQFLGGPLTLSTSVTTGKSSSAVKNIVRTAHAFDQGTGDLGKDVQDYQSIE